MATLLPLIAAAVTIGGTGTTVGLDIANSGGSKPAPIAPPTPAVINAEQNQEKAVISQQAPNILAQTSGLANPDYVATISQLLSNTGGQTGSAGAAGDVIKQLFGLSAGSPSPLGSGGSTGSFTPASSAQGSNPNAGSSPVNLSDFVNRFIYEGA